MEDDKILNLEDRIINIIMDVFLKFKNNSFYFSLLILSMHTTFLSYTALKKKQNLTLTENSVYTYTQQG